MITVESLVPWAGGALVVGGVAVLASRRRQLMLRWCFWAVGVPAVIALFWWGAPGRALLAGSAAVVAALEFGALVTLPKVDRAVLAGALVAVVLTVWLAPDQTARVVAAALLAITAVPLATGDTARGLHRLGASVTGLAWLGPLAGLVPLGATALALFLAVSLADIVAYFAGPALGGPHLSPLSPAKRWSGMLAGAAAGVGLLALLGALSWPTAIAVAVGAPAGDLVESMVKRGVGVKDSGSWMAGAGGLLDRIDSILMALAVTLVLH